MSLLIDIEHRSFEATLRRCEDLGGVDLLFFSPPYPTALVGAKGAAGAPTRDYGGDAPKHFLWEDYQRLGDCCYRALKPGGFCIVIVDGPVRVVDKSKGSERSLIAFRLAIDWADRVGFRYVEHEAYLRLSMPGKLGPRRRSGWEPMHVLQRPGGDGHFDPWAITEPALVPGKVCTNAAVRMYSGMQRRGRKDANVHVQTDRKTLSTAIRCSPNGMVMNLNSTDPDHPAPFSRYVASAQVLSYSPPGGLVCDPFNGSGTTGIAAAKHGRNFVGGDLGAREKDGRRWADIGRERALEAAGMWPEQRGEALAGQPARPAAQQLGLL